MFVSEKIKEKEFIGRTMKDAYLKCCKWLSSNIIAINNSNNIAYRIEKIKTKDATNKVKLTMYVVADEEEISDRSCSICKEVSGSFFMKENKYMCEVCRVQPYRKRMQDKLKSIKEGLKGRVL